MNVTLVLLTVPLQPHVLILKDPSGVTVILDFLEMVKHVQVADYTSMTSFMRNLLLVISNLLAIYYITKFLL